jgi:hypothetical protein
VILYDNLKAAVLERQGRAVHFHPLSLGNLSDGNGLDSDQVRLGEARPAHQRA